MNVRRPSAPRRAGMTLLEILVSAVLTLTVCVLVAELSMGMLRGVKTASGRMVFTQKLERLRQGIEDDLSKLVLMDGAMQVLDSDLGDRLWTMNLTLPVSNTSNPWQTVRYRWEPGSGSLWREVDGVITNDPIPLLTGIVSWHAEWLRDLTTEATGSPSWHDSGSLPAALRIKARLTGVWEAGEVIDPTNKHGTREFVLLLPVGGGKGGQ